jgi:multiple sugar transport system ATP-binding protein
VEKRSENIMEVKLTNLTKKFRNTVAVDNLTLLIPDGQFLCLLGPSGCGKTTTLRCIAGLESPDTGEIYIGDKLVNDLAPKDRDIAMVFQDYALYNHMTVYDNIAFPLRLKKVPKNEIRKRVEEVAEILHIKHLLTRRPAQLSGGERQRVATGRAIVRKPAVFLMDEPLSNLDALLRIQMRVELKRLKEQLKITTIYVTHDQIEAMSLADKIALMDKGALQQIGTPHEIYYEPANTFVAKFVGAPSINLINGNFLEEKSAIDLGFLTIEIPKEISNIIKEKASGSEIIVGIRPDDISISEKPRSGFIKGEVYVMQPLGSETQFELKVDESILTVKTYGTYSSKIGDTIWFTLKEEKIHIFDKKTGKVIS